jgi:hypothetical protein
LSGFKFSKNAEMFLGQGVMRLWRRAHFCLGETEFIFGDCALGVCDGAHSLFVMKKIGAGERNNKSLRGNPTSRNARSGQTPVAVQTVSTVRFRDRLVWPPARHP